MALHLRPVDLQRLDRAGYCVAPKTQVPEHMRTEYVEPILSRPHHDALRAAICEYFGVDLAELLGLRRYDEIAWPRMIGMYVARVHLNLTWSETALTMNRSDHTTAISAARRVQAALDDPNRDKETALDVEYVRRRAVALRAQLISKQKASS